ncbi:hypothetical protein ONS96_004962 [Cadophora gregata f. sp. sojae]|nr:hypothetical protein ONS96_004962 [Cadophora gregata f. sp. sojae]
MLLTIHRSPFCEKEEITLRISTIITDMLLHPHPSVEVVVQEVNQLYLQWSQQNLEEELGRDESSFLWWLWTEFWFIVPQIPYHSPAQEISVKFAAAKQDVHDDLDRKWRVLDDFGMAAWEAQNDTEQGTQEEINLYSFSAKLTRDSIRDFSTWTIYSFRDILEDEPSPTAPAWWRAQATQKGAPRIDARLPVAALWIDIIGEKLLRSDQYRGSGAKGVGTWKGKKAGFCLERWRLWKRRFEEISVDKHVSEKTRGIAKRTWERMGVIEGENMDIIERAEIFAEWMVDFDPSAFGSWAYDPEAGRRRGKKRKN